MNAWNPFSCLMADFRNMSAVSAASDEVLVSAGHGVAPCQAILKTVFQHAFKVAVSRAQIGLMNFA